MSRRRVPRPTTAVITTAALIALVLPACTSADEKGPPEASTSAVATGRGLERYYTQKIAFGPCASFATTATEAKDFANDQFRCGRLTVPLDYDKPNGRTARVAVLRRAANGDAIGSLVVNPGGPGPTGTGFAAALSKSAAKTGVLDRFDLVGFDPRGTGASTPALDCLSDSERDKDAVVIPFIAGGERYDGRDTARLAKQCAARSGGPDVLANAGVRNVARDMDVLRAVLGDQKLTYLGDSWGTRLGAVYSEMFPTKVRAMVLDGGVNPDEPWSRRAPRQFAAFLKSFDQVARQCAKSDDCPLGDDPAQATRVFHDLLRPLQTKPLPATGLAGEERTLTRRAALDGVIAGLYDQAAWPAIIAGLKEVKAGRGDTLVRIRDSYHQRAANGRYTNFLENTTAIYCADEQRLSPVQATAMRRTIMRTAPFLDLGEPTTTRDGCEHWPGKPSLGFPYGVGDTAAPQAVVVSVTGDPATPYEDGAALARSLRARLVTVHGNKHGAALSSGNACIDGHVTRYLIDAVRPPAGAECTL